MPNPLTTKGWLTWLLFTFSGTAVLIFVMRLQGPMMVLAFFAWALFSIVLVVATELTTRQQLISDK